MFDGHTTQRNLAVKGYALVIDGNLGPKSFAALLVCASGRHAADVPLAGELGAALATQLGPSTISTPLRLRHFLAQCACETAGFTTMEEKASGAAYEGRTDLGNIQHGDGPRFKGRGLLDTTGRWNYQHLHNISGIDCVENPALLAMPVTAVQAALSFWHEKNVNAAADADDIVRVTRIVNGGLNGLSDRKIYFQRLRVIAA